MKTSINADHKLYNANSRDANVGDCVKRSLSIAYGLDYDEVSLELNRIKRDLGLQYFNIYPVYSKFISNHGYAKFGKISDFVSTGEMVSIDYFCELFPKGIYIILCSPPNRPEVTTHMVTVIDGDFWDSWDCSNYYAVKIWDISSYANTSTHSDNVSAVISDIVDVVDSCLEKYNKKMPWARFELMDPIISDNYTFSQKIRCIIDKAATNLGYADYYRPTYSYTFKINPRINLDDNVSQFKQKIYVRIREWAYSVRKEVEDDMNEKSLSTHSDFYGDRRLLLKLPEWARSLVTEAIDNGTNSDAYGYDRYELYMDAFPDDPRYSSDPSVMFSARTIPELRQQLNDYKDHFYRFNYDY